MDDVGVERGWTAPPWRVGVELAAAGAVAVVTSLAVQLAVSRVHLPFPSAVPGVLVAAGSLVGTVALLAVVVAWRGWPSRVATWAGLAGLVTWVLALPLLGTRYYFSGLNVDQTFRTTALARYASSPAWADMTYAGLPPYYPPTWFWLAGRAAALTGTPGWAMYKPWAILTMAVSVALATVLWGAVTSRRSAALLGLLTLVVGIMNGSGEPYAWFLVALMVPVVVLAWRALAVAGPRRRWTLLGAGAFLGLCAAVYTLYAGFVAMVVVLLALLGARAQRRAGASWAVTARETAVRLVLVALPAAVIGLAVWGPYLLAAARAGFPTSSAPRFLPEGGTQLPLPMFEASGFGLLSAVGVGWLVVAVRASGVARALATLSLAVYLWYVLSALALVARTTLLAFRLDVVLQLSLAAAAVFGGLALLRRLSLGTAVRRDAVRAGALVAATLAVVSILQPPRGGMGDPDDVAYTNPYPTGRTASGVLDPAEPGAWTPGILDAIARATPRAPRDTVVLGGATQLYVAEPFHGFQASMDQFANPLADYDGRNRLIEAWTRAPDLPRALDASPYAPPDVFVLRPAPDGLHLGLSEDRFPAYPNVHEFDVVFPARLFATPAFTTETVGPFLVAVRR